MNNAMILLTPVLVFILVGLFAFVGCASFTEAKEEEKKPPEQTPPPDQPPVTPPDQPPVTPPTKPLTYIETVKATPGFTAIWPLNETIGKVAAVDGMPSTANGTYTTATGADPAPGTYVLGKAGVLFPKDNQDFAAEFSGGEAFIEVPFIPAFNPGPAVPGFSVELWVKPDPGMGGDRHVVVSSHHFDSMTSQQGYEIGLLKVPGQQQQQIYARVYGGSASLQTEISVQPDEGLATDWRHIVFRYGFIAGTGYVIRLRVQVINSAKLFEAQSAAGVVYEQVTMAKQSTLRFAGSHLPPPGTSAVFAGRLDNIAFYNALILDGDINTHFSMAPSI
jgi:U5 snRNP spliceosome subunit